MTNVLYTKYRPKSFEQVIGQAPVIRSLTKVLKDGTNRTFLFDGPSGTGKTTLARICAGIMGCAETDIQEIAAAVFTGVDDMRGVISGLSYRPLGKSEQKAVILDEAHMLSKAAWNSLLKLLEEPPSYLSWYICTTEASKVPESIKTRCTRYQLKPVGLEELVDLLGSIADKEKLDTPDDILRVCAKEAGGSPRQAIVNLALCANAKGKAEAAGLLASATDVPQAIDLARALVSGAPWTKLTSLLSEMKDLNPESIRQVVMRYLTTVVLGASSADKAGRALEILDAFSQPFPNDGLGPVVLAVGRAMLS